MKKPLSVVLDVMHGKTSTLRKKLEHGANPNERFRDRTLLNWACQEGHLKVVRLLIEFGAEVNAGDTDFYGATPLVTAAGAGHNAIVRELLKAGADANARVRGISDGTALHLACAWDHTAVVKTLLEMPGVDINARDRDGKTPLANVLEPGTNGQTGDKQLAAYLIKHGAVC
jgi:ankyrin repeat protein